MQTLFSESIVSLSWLISYTRDISILICFIFIIKFIAAKKLPAWWSYSLWLILLFRMLIPWRIENRLNVSNLLNVEIDTDIMRLMLMGKETGMIDLTPAASSGWWQGWSLSLEQTLLVLWLAGTVVFGLYILVKNTRFWLMIKGRAGLTEKRTLDLLGECKGRLGIHRSIDVIVTDKVKSPALFGYFHPRLLLPEGVLEDLKDEELAYVFMHELGHLKRHDIAVSCLITLFQAIHWFNPLVWFAFYQMRIDQEAACDASVLAKLKQHQSTEYANAIVSFLERYCRNRQLPSMAGILENKTQMKRRLTMIINYKKLSTTMTVMASVLLITTGFFFFTLTGFAEIKGQTELSQSEQQALTDASQALLANNLSDAEEILEGYLDSNPSNVPDILYSMLGAAYYNQQKLDEAANVFEQAYEAYPEKTDYLINHATVAYENKEYNTAGRLFEEAYEKVPGKDKEYLKKAAACYYQGNNLEDTKRVFEKLNDLSGGKDPELLETIYSISSELGQKDEMKKYLSQMMELNPEKEEYKRLLMSIDMDEEKFPSPPSLYATNFKSQPIPVQAKAQQQSSTSDVSQEFEEVQAEKDIYAGNAYMLAEVDTPPQVLTSVSPQYPFLAKRENIEGEVILRFVVTKEGTVAEPEIIESDPAGVFDEAALTAIEQYVFKPGTKNGETVNVIVRAPMRFELR